MDTVVLDGFRYEFQEGRIWKEGHAAPQQVVVLKLIDEARGIEVQAYFPREGWEEFNKTINGGVLVPSPDALRRLGV